MNKTIARYLVLNLGLVALLLLVILSIAGAFLGAQKASVFFNSPPLAVVWIALAGLFIAAFILWKSLLLRPYLLLCHLGFVAVLLGGLWGSAAAHALRAAAGLPAKVTKGTIVLGQGQTGSQIILDNQTGVFELPFDIHLAETGVTHYDEPAIAVYDVRGRFLGTIPAEVGDPYTVPGDSPAQIQVTQRYENLRLISPTDGGAHSIEGESGHFNPGYEIIIRTPDGQEYVIYVFERFEPHFLPHIPFLARFIPPRMPQEYKSHLILEKDGHILTQKTIRVNDPLHYGGYHFYQSTFGRDERGPYSGIMVVSDSGVGIVFFGYALLTVGLFGQFWVKPFLRRRKQQGGSDAH